MTRRLFLSILPLLAIALAAAAPQTEEPSPRYTIVAFGDSTTAPRSVDGEALRVYADILRDRFEAAAQPVRLINAGVPGDTTAKARARFGRDVQRHDPDLVIIQFGVNDSCVDVQAGKTKPRVPLTVYWDNLAFFVEALRARGSAVILMTPNPLLWTDELRQRYGKPPYPLDDRWGFNLFNAEYAEAVRRIAKNKEVPLIDLYQRFRDYDAQERQTADELLLDGMHPNAAGHAMIAQWLLQQITKMPDTPKIVTAPSP